MPSLVRRAGGLASVAAAALVVLAGCHRAAGEGSAGTLAARDAHWGTSLELRASGPADLDTAVIFPERDRVVGVVPVTLHELVAEGTDSSKARPVRFQVQRVDLGADTTDAGGFCAPVLRDRRTGVVFVRTRWFVEGYTSRREQALAPNASEVTMQRVRTGRADYAPLTPAPVRVPAGAWVRVQCAPRSATVLGLAPATNLGA